MRCALCLFFVVTAATGCKNNASPITNPFLTPDRVPPPSTGTLAPGTAQPYYQGGPLPGTAVAAPMGAAPPVTAYPPTTAPLNAPPGPVYGTPIPTGAPYPAPTYQGSPVTPGAPVTPVTPPGGWNGTSPRAELSPGGDAVRLAADEQPLRFDSAAVNGSSMPTPALAATPVSASMNGSSTAMTKLPIQNLLPLEQDPRVQRLAGQQEVEQASWGSPLPSPPLQGEGAGRTEIIQAAATVPRVGGDGFRPQGTTSAAELQSADGGFRPPEIRRETMEAQNSTAKYGVGSSQEWLRGQLEYWPELGKWSIRYMDPAGPVDQIGGRVLIENPQVLGNLPPGEFVMIRGQVFGQQIDESSYQPAYRVATVERQAK